MADSGRRARTRGSCCAQEPNGDRLLIGRYGVVSRIPFFAFVSLDM
jgi:hypothetical protein